jgi:purine-cytosine permease-like protein
MAQTKLESAVEVVVNVLIGYVVATASQIMIFPLFGIFLPLSDNLLIGAYFTAISIVRGYVVRRFFNRKTNEIHGK